MAKIISLLSAIIMFIFPCLNIPKTEAKTDEWKTDYTFVFVHGLSGWGSYDAVDKIMPYWGMFGGNLITYLNARGFECRSASVTATASSWDRACELYAQLTGTKTDYGEEHAKRCNHKRYGKDFTGRALIDKWSAEDKINLLGHSFGGATVRLFSEILANGSEAEQKATPANEISEFFKGGRGDWIYSITSLAAPHNGTTAYDIKDIVAEDENATVPEKTTSGLLSVATAPINDGRDENDSAAYDMRIDNAMKLNEGITTFENIYYFSFACCATEENADGTSSPVESKMERLFIPSSKRMGSFEAVTEGGVVLDKSWRKNDGLVNTVSAMYPFGAPHTDFNKDSISRGIWNVMPIYSGDHMSLQGGMTVKNNVRELYADHLNMINSL